MADSSQLVEPPDARDALRPIWSRRGLILFIVVVATTVTYGYYLHAPKQYRATTSIFVRSSAADQVAFGSINYVDDQRNTLNQAQLLHSRDVAAEVAKRIGFKGDPGALLGRVKATPSADSDFVTITATGRDPVGTARLANQFAKSFIRARSAAQRAKVERARNIAQAELDAMGNSPQGKDAAKTLKSRIRQLNVILSLPAGSAEVVDSAQAPGRPFAPRPKRSAVFALLLSGLLGVGLAYGLEAFDRRLKRLDDVEGVYGYPLLGLIPRTGDAAPKVAGRAEISESHTEPFRSLRMGLQLAALDRPLRRILVTSAIPGEGKSTVVRNLAMVYAEAGSSVAVFESDLRRPTLGKLFGVQAAPGLTNVLADQTDLSGALQSVASTALAPIKSNGRGGHDGGVATALPEAGHINLLTSGPTPANPPSVLATQRLREVLATLSEQHDMLLIDSPPLLAVSDAIPLLDEVDGVLIVSRLDLTTRDAARRMRDMLSRIPDAKILGVVANDVTLSVLGGSNYAYYGYRSDLKV